MNPSPLVVEMQSILDRADELAGELAKEYELSARRGAVTERARNLYHEILVKLRSALDFAMFRIFTKYSAFHGQQRAKSGRKAIFPICDSEQRFCEHLESLGLDHLDRANPELCNKLRRIQPFVTKHKGLLILRDLSNMGKHRMLPRQAYLPQPATRYTAPDGKVVLCSRGVVFNNGKSDQPWPNCRVEQVVWGIFAAYDDSDQEVFPSPDWLCLDLRSGIGSYLQKLQALI